MEDAMLKETLWSKSVPQVELDQRARDARLQLERIERLLVPRATVTNSWLRWTREPCAVQKYSASKFESPN
jgi:hypothetical protein